MSDPFWDEEEPAARRGRGSPGQEGYRPLWRGTSFDRVMVARGYAPAVVKVTSFNRGQKGVLNRINYISREGSLGLETDQGLTLESLEEQRAYVNGWASGFTTRRNGRDSMSLMLSTPKGIDKAAAQSAMRDFLAAEFGGKHEYVFTVHDDTEYFHCHTVIKVVGHQGARLNPRKADLQRYRERYAAALRARKIRVEASPRYARGRGQRARGTAIYQLLKRGMAPLRQKIIKTALMAEISAGRTDPDSAEGRQLYRNGEERIAYAQAAVTVISRGLGESVSDSDKAAAVRYGAELARFAQVLPIPKTLRRREFEHYYSNRETPQRNRQKLKIPGVEDTRRLLKKSHELMQTVAETIKDAKFRTAAKSSINLIRPKQHQRELALARERALEIDLDYEI